MDKTLTNSDVAGAKAAVQDLVVFGDGDLWQLLCKASSKAEGWMKSTKAMEVAGGCLVQVTTQQNAHIAEAVTFVPNVMVLTQRDDAGKIVARRLRPAPSPRAVAPLAPPSKGRIVLYNHPGSADGKYPPQQSPAIIQHVHDDGTAKLFVFGPKGQHMDDNLRQGDGPCEWNWPPRV